MLRCAGGGAPSAHCCRFESETGPEQLCKVAWVPTDQTAPGHGRYLLQKLRCQFRNNRNTGPALLCLSDWESGGLMSDSVNVECLKSASHEQGI